MIGAVVEKMRQASIAVLRLVPTGPVTGLQEGREWQGIGIRMTNPRRLGVDLQAALASE